jgi:hypothetical protein
MAVDTNVGFLNMMLTDVGRVVELADRQTSRSAAARLNGRCRARP